MEEEVIDDMLEWLNTAAPKADGTKWTKDEAVLWLQQSLVLQEYLTLEPNETDPTLPGEPTGIYDLKTKLAVEALQRYFELDKDKTDYHYGVVDAETLAKIVEENARIMAEQTA